MSIAKSPNIYQRLHKAIQTMNYVEKKKQGGMPFKAVLHDDVLLASRQSLIDVGVIAFPVTIKFTQDGNRSGVEMGVRFQNIDDPLDFIDVPTVGQGIGNDDKGPGKAISYAFKYALLKTLAMRTGDDPDKEDQKHMSKEDIALKSRIELRLSNVKTTEDMQNFRNETKEDMTKLSTINKSLANDIREKVKNYNLT
jgi:hypothetical protein|tara:strand:+ start:3274 stop:3861 length:588 start_codon:yes stop_codon:yes gene_type:complete